MFVPEGLFPTVFLRFMYRIRLILPNLSDPAI